MAMFLIYWISRWRLTLCICCRCLAHNQQDRLDVLAAASHPYLLLKRPGTPQSKPTAPVSGTHAC